MFGEWQWQAMWDALPPGFRFHPTDHESVDHYLMNYISGNPDKVLVIPVVDNIFKRDPSELPCLFRGSSIIRSRDPEWWFLSTLEYKSSHNNKFDRSTGKGSWKITGNPKKIYGRGENRQIAEMRNLVFCENPRNEETTWVIHEYNLKDNSMELTLRDQRKYVLCHLVNKKYDYTDTTTNMEVDLEFEECEQGFSEEVIEAKIRSLRAVLDTPAATDSSLHNPWESCEASFGRREVDPVNHQFREMSTNSGEQDSMLELLNYVDFDLDEEIAHSDELDIAYVSKLLDFEETSASPRTISNQAVLKENRQARPPGSLEGYVFIDETSGFVEDDSQSEETSNASTVTDLPKAPPSTKYPVTSPDEHFVGYSRRMEPRRNAGFLGTDHRSTTPWMQEGKAKGGSLTGEVRGKKEQGTWTERAGNEDRSRPPFDYLVNLAVGMVLLVLMILWALC